MTKFNRSTSGTGPQSPVKTEQVASGLTFEGAPGHVRDGKSELFLLAVTNLVSEDTFYEQAKARDSRYVSLIRQLALEDPFWVFGLAGWLRSEANMRSASIVMATEFVKARLEVGLGLDPRQTEQEMIKDGGLNRRIINTVLQRADEPGELLAYWISKYGRTIPKSVKRGVADAVRRLYNEYALLKYDTDSKAYRFGDVLELVHASPAIYTPNQGDLFEYAIDRRHGHADEIPVSLEMVAANAWLREAVKEDAKLLLDPGKVRGAGLTWEDVKSLGGALKLNKQALWMSVIPSMGYMALLRNLRNFDQAQIPDELARRIGDRLADPAQVARSRQFPFRFLSAYNANSDSLRWAWALEQALNHSLSNVPELPGRTLVLVDRSPSMWMQKFSEHSDMSWADAAAVFGVAVALRAESADLVEFGIENGPVSFRRGDSVLRIVERLQHLSGTDIPAAVQAHLREHDRVVIVTDEQTRPGWLPSNAYGYGGGGSRPIDEVIPKKTPLYMWNFGGYSHGAVPSGGSNRHILGGLSDSSFQMISLLEAGRNADWPWED